MSFHYRNYFHKSIRKKKYSVAATGDGYRGSRCRVYRLDTVTGESLLLVPTTFLNNKLRVLRILTSHKIVMSFGCFKTHRLLNGIAPAYRLVLMWSLIEYKCILWIFTFLGIFDWDWMPPNNKKHSWRSNVCLQGVRIKLLSSPHRIVLKCDNKCEGKKTNVGCMYSWPVTTKTEQWF